LTAILQTSEVAPNHRPGQIKR